MRILLFAVMNIFLVTNSCIRLLPVISYVSQSRPVSRISTGKAIPMVPWRATAGETPAILVHCNAYKLTLIGWKRARCKERAAKTGSIRPIEPQRGRRWPVSGQPAGGGQGSVGFVARRDSIHQYTFLASRPGPLGLPSKLIYRRYSALGYNVIWWRLWGGFY